MAEFLRETDGTAFAIGLRLDPGKVSSHLNPRYGCDCRLRVGSRSIPAGDASRQENRKQNWQQSLLVLSTVILHAVALRENPSINHKAAADRERMKKNEVVLERANTTVDNDS